MRLSKIIPSIAYNTFFQIGAFALILFLGSCDNENEQITLLEESQGTSLLFDKRGIEKAELKEKLAYKNHHLTNLMEEALRIKPDFEEQLQKKTSSSSFYFEDLLSENIINKGRTKRNDSIQFSMDAFLELEGESWYPYVQKIKDGRGEESLYLINSYDPDTEREIVQGYKIDKSGKLELKYRDLSEEDIFGANPIPETLGNDVYVLGISPDNVEPIKEEQALDCEGGCGGSPSGGGNGGNLSEDLHILKIRIKDKKESWLEKADVHIYGYAMSDNVNFFQPLGYYWGDRGTIDGAQIRNNPEYVLGKFSNSDVNNATFKNINKYLMNKSVSGSVFISYIIYEYDGFPAPLKQVSFGRPTETDAVISYRSYNQKYISAQVRACDIFEYDNYFVLNGFGNSISNSVIEYHFNAAN